jgi:hypothetical protein
MLSQRRGASVSIDASASRAGGRERWIPLNPEESDLRSRSYLGGATTISEEAKQEVAAASVSATSERVNRAKR